MLVLLSFYTLFVMFAWIAYITGGASLVVAILITLGWVCSVAPRWIQVRRGRR